MCVSVFCSSECPEVLWGLIYEEWGPRLDATVIGVHLERALYRRVKGLTSKWPSAGWLQVSSHPS